ncbi:hypothetical protein Q6348_08105 [Isoptericola sp. b441]|uniref:DNA methylase n=1 Tax=Actinotalea lenta TaxID=3064654 RepID=A0ABT9DD37_9CELL|nr:hypothetical protein [Isoptericola sp. b441]MDO8107158.1 hypothetical protein [Isoptericola sp. b441]
MTRLTVVQGDASHVATARVCAWCQGPIPAQMRRDAECCSTRCRQARHRFTRGVGVGSGSATTPLRLAYADPPYPGKAWLYRDHPDYGGEVDHAELIRRLSTYDGWALSTSAEALPVVLASCPPGVRVAAWFRGARPNRSAVRPLNAWEPVIYSGGRAVRDRHATRPGSSGDGSHVLEASATGRTDTLVHVARPRTTDPKRVIGAKPAVFARWIFDLLGALPGDELHDLFPGSGGIARAWDLYASPSAARDA